MNKWQKTPSRGKWALGKLTNWLLIANRYVTLVVAIAYSVKSKDRTVS